MRPAAARATRRLDAGVVDKQRRRQISRRGRVRNVAADGPAVLDRHCAGLARRRGDQRELRANDRIVQQIGVGRERADGDLVADLVIPRSSLTFQRSRKRRPGSLPASSRTIRSVPPANGVSSPAAVERRASASSRVAADAFGTGRDCFSSGNPGLHRGHHRFEDAHVAGTATEVAGQADANVVW